MKHLLIIVIFITIFIDRFDAQTIIINELMSDNETTIQDMDGEFNDWIELYNTSPVSVNLLNYSLSDDENELNKWVFPDVSIPGHGFLLLFCSGKDISDIGELHTNFKIKQSGETIILSNADNDIESLVNAISIPSDNSLASIPDGSANRSIVILSTPNSSNESSNGIYCSHPSGFYTEEFMLTLSPSNDSLEIRYTLDGSTPGMNSLLYSSPVQVSDVSSDDFDISSIPTTPLDGPTQFWEYIWKTPQSVYQSNVIRYASFQSGEMQSQVSTKTYFVDPDIYTRYTFPIVSMVTDSIHLFDYDSGIYIPGKTFDENGFNWWATGNYHNRGIEWERRTHLSFFEHDGTLSFESDVGMRMRGYGSTCNPQKSFGVYFRDDYGLDRINYPVFESSNADVYKRLVFRNSGSDFLQTHFRDGLLQDLIFDMNLDLQNFKASLVFINGEYWGIHGLRQKYDEHYFKYHFGIEEDDINILGICGQVETGDNTEYNEFVGTLEEVDMTLEESYLFVQENIDIQNFMDFQIAEIYYANYDWPCNNFKIWKSNAPNSKWRFLIYDLDLSFGFDQDLSSYATSSLAHATMVANEWPYCECSSLIFRKLLENDEFRTDFINRFAHHLNTTFKTENVLNKIDDYVTMFLPEIEEHIERWNYPATVSQWYQHVQTMREYAEKRPCFIQDEIIKFFDLENFDFECLSNTFDEETLLIAPNPSNGELFLFNNLQRDYQGEIHISGMDGRVVYVASNFALNSGERKYLNVSMLPAGTYIFNYSSNDFSEKRKLMIVKQ